MKFLVGDNQLNRHRAVLAFLTEEQAVIAVILAAINLEWTIRRVIDGMLNKQSETRSRDHVSSLEKYKKAWLKAVSAKSGKTLPEVVGEWKELKDAYQARHDIVHGMQGSIGMDFASPRVRRILAASEAIAKYGSENGADPYQRLKKRILSGPTPRKELDVLKSKS